MSDSFGHSYLKKTSSEEGPIFDTTMSIKYRKIARIARNIDTRCLFDTARVLTLIFLNFILGKVKMEFFDLCMINSLFGQTNRVIISVLISISK